MVHQYSYTGAELAVCASSSAPPEGTTSAYVTSTSGLVSPNNSN